ncbi:MAG TPA: prolipoprotein diacylglyceryl transferase family protein [Acidobacteriaceae bacterium]|nr:prolipoprotein diacylglyceryl transferase family protein [Acidobacteriaceae bacterium]
MYPFIHLGSLTIGTFGILLWFAAVCACWALYANFKRWNIDADAISIVAIATVAGVVGAKLWHDLQDPQMLIAHPIDTIFSRAGFAWFGGLLLGIAALLWQGRTYGIGKLRMLDLCTVSACIGYGVGRIGCLVSGDGDYGIPTKMPWGIALPHGLVPTPPGVKVEPTPIYELIVALLIAWLLWRRGAPDRPKQLALGQLTGEYLVLSGLARFLVEFIRINPKLYFGMSNAQVASIGSMIAGAVLIWWAKKKDLPSEQPVRVGAQSGGGKEIHSPH